MQKERKLWQSMVSSMLIIALMFCAPFEAVAQSASKSNLLENGTQVMLQVNENFQADNSTESGIINAVVASDVYSADGTKVLIKAGTPATIQYTTQPNGSWGKAGKTCLTSAQTKGVDGKQISLRLGSCKNGGGKLGGVIALSVIFFPIGLISGCMKGSMPKIPQGAVYTAMVVQDTAIN